MNRLLGSLRQKLLVLLIIVAVLPVIVMVIINIRGTTRLLEDEVQERQLETIRIVAGQMDEFIRDIELDLHNIGQAGLDLNLDSDQLNQYLLTYLRGTTQPVQGASIYDSLWLMDVEGNEIARVSGGSAIPAEELQNRHQEEIFFRPERGETYFSTVRLVAGVPQISVSLPITQDGVFIGAIGANITLDEPWSVIRNLVIGENGYALLVDQRGNLIVHRDEAVLSQRRNLANTPAISDAIHQPERTIIHRYDSPIGGDVLGSAVLIPGPDWILAIERPASEALQAENQARQNAIIAVSVSLGLAVVIGLLLARQITQPLLVLRNAARQFGEGELSLRAAVTSRDEIGELAQSFNRMAQQLSDSIGNLEERVQARTRDLRLAADVSRQITTVLDLDTLLSHLAEQTRQAFSLYHVSVFIYDQTTEELRLEAATGEIGQQMKEDGKVFRLTDPQGLVPKAAYTQEPVVVNDTHNSPDHFANPALPYTHSEIAIPMIIGTKLVGVLDLQAKELDRFQKEDVEILRSLADQIAIAVQNAELYTSANCAREEAEKANKVKSQFLAAMSHELRTPLNGIINFTGFVADQMLGPVNEKQVKFLQDAIANAEHLLALINDILDISKIEAGALKLFIEDRIDVAQELKAVARIGETLLESKPVGLIVDIPDALPPVRGDKRRIRQIMYNLVSNACKFTDTGSVTLAACQQEGELLLTVKDTGPGIAPEDHELIFQTFWQTETGLRKGGGTGLGLPISRKLAEAHGGRLWLESQLGNGATFFVALPIQPETVETNL